MTYSTEGIIDFHAHAFPDGIEAKAVDFLRDYYHLDITNGGRITDLNKSAHAAGVEYVVIHATATKPDQVSNVNSWIANNINSHTFGFGTLHADFKDNINEIDRIISLGLKGIKLHPDFQEFNIDDEKMFPVYEAVGDRLIILFHTGDKSHDYSSPRRLARVLDNFPKLKVVAAHMGGYSQWSEAEKLLIGRNLYFDTCSTIYWLPQEDMIRMIRKHGPDKILFGTDYPIKSHSEELKAFMHLPLTEEERRLILFDNAATLLLNANSIKHEEI